MPLWNSKFTFYYQVNYKIRFSENDNVSICIVWNDIKLYSSPKIIEHISYKDEAAPENRNMKCELEECLNLFQKSVNFKRIW